MSMSRWDGYVGLPYQDGARGPDAFDCWGLVRWVLAREFGVELPEYNYGMDRASRWDAIVEAESGFRQVEGPEPGAVVLMQNGNRRPHVGLCIDREHMLHAARGIGSCIVRLDGPATQNGITGFYLPNHRPA